ncbi:MAG: ATP-binding component of putrescine transport system [Chloroflexi bacterium]|jgi:spermidine/putrescine transport system ATP-binding protein|nr:ATP-binding component of putrescine transport system [Chloroflexota bacterium]
MSVSTYMNAEAPSVELRGVSKRFGSVSAVDDVSLTVRKGEFLTLLGPSGCGKTTSLRIVAGFERPSGGTIHIDGQAVTALPPNKRNVNTVFQNYALFPHMNLAENVGFGLRMKRLGRADIERRVDEAMALVRLEGLGKRKPTQLSGGQQQRVALARALVNRPAVLLLDEPLGALDLKLRRAMQFELRHLNQSVGITFIYVTHDQEEALTMSDRIAVMSGGRILQIGTAQEIYEAPATRFVADFIGESNFLEGTISDWENGVATVDVAGAGAIRARCVDRIATGIPVSVALRPERIIIEPSEQPAAGVGAGENVVRGRLLEAVYAGSTLQYAVSLGDAAQLIVRSPNLGQAAGVGNDVSLRWSIADCSVLVA